LSVLCNVENVLDMILVFELIENFVGGKVDLLPAMTVHSSGLVIAIDFAKYLSKEKSADENGVVTDDERHYLRCKE